MASSKDNNLELFIRFLQALHKVGPQVDARTNRFLSWKVYFKDHVWVLSVNVVYTVH